MWLQDNWNNQVFEEYIYFIYSQTIGNDMYRVSIMTIFTDLEMIVIGMLDKKEYSQLHFPIIGINISEI